MPFQPGQSGNPNGRPKVDTRLRDLAREHTETAIQALVDALADDKTRVSAAVALLDRGWGRPVQEVTGADGGPIQTSLTVHFVKPPADLPAEVPDPHDY